MTTILLKLGVFLGLLATIGIRPAFSQAEEETDYRHWVDYRDGEISAVFAQAPVAVALREILERTGFHIMVPSTVQNKLLTLRLNRLQLEPAVRSLLSSIGLMNFAMIYDETGRPHRAVVLGGVDPRATVESKSNFASHSGESSAQPLTEQEREKLQKELARWSELKQEERGRIEDRLKALPSSEEQEQLVKEYGKQLLGIKTERH